MPLGIELRVYVLCVCVVIGCDVVIGIKISLIKGVFIVEKKGRERTFLSHKEGGKGFKSFECLS